MLTINEQKRKKLTFKKNIHNRKIKKCSTNPMTGYYRDGYCMTGPDDLGTHTVCAKMNPDFLKYTASKGNDLSCCKTRTKLVLMRK